MSITDRTFASEDGSGNKIYLKVFFNEKQEKINAKIAIKLKSEKTVRNMGTFDFLTRTFYCYRNSSKHYHYKTKGYAFNWNFLQDPFLAVENVHMVIDDSDHYEFPKSVINEHGIYLNFKEQGFELQRFLPFEIIKRYYVPNKKSTDGKQDGDIPKDDETN